MEKGGENGGQDKQAGERSAHGGEQRAEDARSVSELEGEGAGSSQGESIVVVGGEESGCLGKAPPEKVNVERVSENSSVVNKIINEGELEEAGCSGVSGEEELGENNKGISECSESLIGDDMDFDDALSDISNVSEGNMYSVEEISKFLSETKGKTVKLTDYFPDLDKFVVSALAGQRTANYELLTEQQRYRLKKHVTIARRVGKAGRVAMRKGTIKQKPRKGKNKNV